MSTKKDENKDEKKTGNGSGPRAPTVETLSALSVEEAFSRWKAQGGLLLVKTIAGELAGMVQVELDAEMAAEKERRDKMDAHFKALGGAPPLDEAEQAATKRKRASRPAPTTDAEIVSRAVEYIKARNAKGKPPEGRGISRETGHEASKVEALLAGNPDVFKGDDKRWHVYRNPPAM